MDLLNELLWLKCRLCSRAYHQSTSALAGLVILLVFMALFQVPAALTLYGYLASQLEEGMRESVHLALLAIYVFWCSMSGLGYFVSEFFDLGRLLIFPARHSTVMLGSVLATFLDPSTLMVYPFLLVVALACAHGPATLGAGILVMMLLAIHTFALVQTVVTALTLVLHRRRVAEVLLVLAPLIVVAIVPAIEWASAGELRAPLAILGLPLAVTTSFIPPGIAANALWAIRAGDPAAALWHTGVLAAVAALTVALGATIVRAVILQARAIERVLSALAWIGAMAARLGGRRAARPAASRVVPLWLDAVVGHRQLLAIALKEWHVLWREPHVRLVAAMYLVFLGILAVGLSQIPARSGESGLLSGVACASVFLMGGILHNCLALEREGLKLLLSCPVAAIVIFLGKNLGSWLMVTAISLPSIVAFGLILGASASAIALHVIIAQVMLVTLMGMGNISSVLAPARLPHKGMVVRGHGSAGHVYLVMFVGTVMTTASALAASVGILVLFWSWIGFRAPMFGPNLVAALVFVGGIYAVATSVAATLLDRRREALTREMAD